MTQQQNLHRVPQSLIDDLAGYGIQVTDGLKDGAATALAKLSEILRSHATFRDEAQQLLETKFDEWSTNAEAAHRRWQELLEEREAMMMPCPGFERQIAAWNALTPQEQYDMLIDTLTDEEIAAGRGETLLADLTSFAAQANNNTNAAQATADTSAAATATANTASDSSGDNAGADSGQGGDQ